MGHEIGYHYENIDAVSKKKKPDPRIPRITQIDANEKLKKITDIKTICMHGSPLSKWDNRMIWEKYSFKDLGITAEPYFDIDYDEVFYITVSELVKQNIKNVVKRQINKFRDSRI